MLIKWDFSNNPYKENLFKQARIPSTEIRARRISAVLQNLSLSHLKDRLLHPEKRFEEELLAHRAHILDRKPMETFLQAFAQAPIDLVQLEAVELTVADITKLVVLPEKGIDPETRQAAFNCPSFGERKIFTEEVHLDY